jgi:hypothetical protein
MEIIAEKAMRYHAAPIRRGENHSKEDQMRDRKRFGFFQVGLMALLLGTASAAAAAQPPSLESSESVVDIHGYVDLTYYDFQKEGDPVLPFTDGLGTPTFDNNHITLFFGANLSQNLKFVSEFHYEHSINEPELPQANMQWQLSKPLTVTFGRFWLPFGTLGKHKIYQPTNELVSYEYIVSQALPFHNAQNGIKLSGEIHPFMYELALSNGFAGLDEDAGKKIAGGGMDNNQNKEFTARVAAHLIEGMDLGGSYLTEKWDDNIKANISLWAVDTEYTIGPLDLQAEYLGGKVQNPDDAVATVDGVVRCNTFPATGCSEADALRDNMGPLSPGDHNRTAYYVQAALQVLKNQLGLDNADLIVRYDVFKRDETNNAGDRARWTAGINIMPQPHFHLKAEYQSVSEPGAQKAVKNNGIMAQAVVDF